MSIELVNKNGVLTLGGNMGGGGAAVEEIYIGTSAPTKDEYKVWVNPTGDIPTELATKEYVDEAISSLDFSDIDLTGLATQEFVTDAISAIELIPGPQGEKGEPGEKGADGAPGKDGKTPVKGVDYYTEQDKQEIVNDVLFALPAAEEVGV